MKRSFLWALVLVLASIGYAQAQSSITGKVTDAKSSQPVPFASVVVKGTTIGITADANGNYSITAPANATTLVFSEVGHTDLEVAINNRTVINVSMEPSAESLDEVVVMGYTTTKRSAITGAVSTIGAAKIEHKPIATIDQALQGNVAGLQSSTGSGQPGSDSRVVIRGIGSVNAGTDPLYIVDGVPITIGNWSATGGAGWSSPQSVMANLNPNDIESISVLKDASATSIYGSRASNGVIVIVTKKGKSGKPKFNVNVQGGLSSRTKKFDMLNRDEYIELTTESLKNSGYTDAMIAADFARFLKDADGNFYDTNWLDDYSFRGNAKTYSADVSVSGGNESTKYFMSISNYHQEAILRWGELDRKSVRVNLSHDAKWINFGVNSTYSYTKSDSPLTSGAYYANPIAGGINLSPLENPYNLDGTYRDKQIGNSGINFVQANDLNSRQSATDRLISNMFAEIVFLKDFRLKTNAGLDYTWISENQWDDLRADGASQKDKGRATKTHQRMRRWTLTNTLTYNKIIAEDHSISALIGQEAENWDYDLLQASKEGFPGHTLTEVDNGSSLYMARGNATANRLASYFGQVTYSFQNKYFFSASFRHDGSSKFGANHKWASFWSVGGAWEISKENFMADVSVINQLKLRASYGTSGNSDIGNYQSYGLYSYGAYNQMNTSYPSQISNPNLTWESQGLFNVGVDFQILDYRLGGTIEYYNRRTKDLLMNVNLSATTGFEETLRNVGGLENQGIEITLNAQPIVTKNFSWKIDATWSMNRNKVTKLVEGQDYIEQKGPGGNNSRKRAYVGDDIQQFWLVRYAGVNPADGAQMWYDANGELSFTRNYNTMSTNGIGSASPKWQAGLTNTLTLYGFDLSALLFFNYGNKIFDNVAYSYQHDGSKSDANEIKDMLNRWQKPGDISKNPKRSRSQNTQVSTRYLFDGSYIRLRNVALGYNLPKSIVEKMKLSNLRVFVQAQNLFTITKYPGQDPEFSIEGENFYQYPASKTWLVGIDIKF